jgi:hypothetical protein
MPNTMTDREIIYTPAQIRLGSVAILEINGKNYKHGQGSKKKNQ